MRLRDLDAQFVDQVSATAHRRMDGDSVVGAQGVQFQCPACGADRERAIDTEREGGQSARRYLVGVHYIMVLFGNPQGADPPPVDAGPRDSNGIHHRWQIVSGTNMDDLTLSPSVDCTKPWKDKDGIEHPSSCKFHGHVQNGDAR